MVSRMEVVLAFVTGVVAAVAGMVALVSLRGSQKPEIRVPRRASSAIAAVNAERSRRKRAAERRILAAVKARGTLVNDDVQELLAVSDATATRYLESLERRGAIRQIGRTGKSVRYEAALNLSNGSHAE